MFGLYAVDAQLAARFGVGDTGQIWPMFNVRPRALPHIGQHGADDGLLSFVQMSAVDVHVDDEGYSPRRTDMAA